MSGIRLRINRVRRNIAGERAQPAWRDLPGKDGWRSGLRASLLVAALASALNYHCASAQGATAGAPHGMTVDDLLRVRSVEEAVVDESSSLVAVVVQRERRPGEPTMGEGLYRGNVRGDVLVFAATTGRILLRTHGHAEHAGYWNPRWAPGGGVLALLALHGDTLSVCIWRRATGTMRCRPDGRSLDYLTRFSVGETSHSAQGSDNAFSWLSDSVLAMSLLPDGRFDPQLVREHRVLDSVGAAWERQMRGKEPTASVLDTPRPDTMPKEFTEIRLWNIIGGTTRVAFHLPYFAHGSRDIVFSPDRKRAAVLADQYRPLSSPRVRYGFHNGTRTELGVVWLTRDTATWWAPRRPYSHVAQWRPDGDRFGVMVKRSEDEDVARGTILLVVDAARVAAESGATNASADSTFRWRARATSGEGRERSIVPDGRLLATAPDGAFSIVRRTAGGKRGVYQMASRGGPPRLLIELNEHLAKVERASRRLISYTARDGSEQRAVLIPPPGFSRRQRYPVVAWLYPGDLYTDTLDANWLFGEEDQVFLNPNVLAGHGYVVLLPSMPFDVPPGGTAEPYRHMLDNLDPAIDSLIARGIADSTRLGIIGHSYGGYAVNCIVSQSHRFQAAVSLAGFADLTSGVLQMQPPSRYSDLPAIWLPWAESGQGRMGGPPWRDPQRYLRNSPISYADSVDSPVLIISGDNDYMGQAEEWFSALDRAGKRARFVRYWGEGHRILSPANVKNLWQEILGWFDTYLGPSRSINRGGAAPGER